MECAFYTRDAGKTTLCTTESVRGRGLILVIDDDRSIRITSKCLLESLGYNVMLAKNGAEGIRKYNERYEDIDMVILDMIMPGMHGDEVFMQLKEINPECKAIIISGIVKREQLPAFFEVGLKGFIEKPFDAVALSELVSKVIHNHV